MSWIRTEDKMPPTGEPVLIVSTGFVQNIVFMYDYLDSDNDWFSPYFFDDVSDIHIPVEDVSHWQPLPEPPKDKAP